jgi:hypothetical protein
MTREQLLKFIDVRNSHRIWGKWQCMLDARAAGFEYNELPKATGGADGSYPTETPHGIMYERKGKLALRDFTPEEQAELDGRAVRLSGLTSSQMTSREWEWYWNNMTPEERDQSWKEIGKGLEANRLAAIARGEKQIDFGQATVDAMRKTTPEERAQDEAWAKVKAKTWPEGES